MTVKTKLTKLGTLAVKTYRDAYAATLSADRDMYSGWNECAAAIRRFVLAEVKAKQAPVVKPTVGEIPPHPPVAKKRAGAAAVLMLLAASGVASAASICEIECLATTASNLAACQPVEHQIGLFQTQNAVTLANLGPYGVSIVALAMNGVDLWNGKLDLFQSTVIAFAGSLDGAVVTVAGIGGPQFLTQFAVSCDGCAEMPEPGTYATIGAGLLLLSWRRFAEWARRNSGLLFLVTLIAILLGWLGGYVYTLGGGVR